MNSVFLEGIVGKVERQGEKIVIMRINHRFTYFDKRKKEYIHEDNWMAITFYGSRGDAALMNAHPGNKIMIEGELVTYPKEGPAQQIRINGKTFHVLKQKIAGARHEENHGLEGEPVEDGAPSPDLGEEF